MSRRLVLKYDIFDDIKNDPDVKHGMVVETLGFDTIGDGFSATYRVISTSVDNSFDSSKGDIRIRSGLYARPVKLAEVDDIIDTIQGKITEINDILDDFGGDVAIINQLSARIHAIEEVINDYATINYVDSKIDDVNTSIDNMRNELRNYSDSTTNTMLGTFRNDIKNNTISDEIDLSDRCGVKIVRYTNGIKNIIITSNYNTESEG